MTEPLLQYPPVRIPRRAQGDTSSSRAVSNSDDDVIRFDTRHYRFDMPEPQPGWVPTPGAEPENSFVLREKRDPAEAGWAFDPEDDPSYIYLSRADYKYVDSSDIGQRQRNLTDLLMTYILSISWQIFFKNRNAPDFFRCNLDHNFAVTHDDLCNRTHVPYIILCFSLVNILILAALPTLILRRYANHNRKMVRFTAILYSIFPYLDGFRAVVPKRAHFNVARKDRVTNLVYFASVWVQALASFMALSADYFDAKAKGQDQDWLAGNLPFLWNFGKLVVVGFYPTKKWAVRCYRGETVLKRKLVGVKKSHVRYDEV
ncbi:hypothetical protein BC936DRAFT_147363 [Jimgerdemannia flammicorona]|uniref:Uncharacterized protein n=1 Tax=Jimgerdemannia flammicorona TaxID=994334 RepID=A0A433D5J1_9FUNG|nr:hypothetical protein BC936DRAFT_147363 [Jimgerdemannia flammicorona]